MPIEIQEIIKGSLAANSKLQINDKIVSINNFEINDFLDLQFYTAEEVLNIQYFDGNSKKQTLVLVQNWQEPVGIIPKQHKCRNCTNNCIFCFVDQMPNNLRNSLYIKDDDYRFSFVFGNFITLTNLSMPDFKRIIKQRLSPLYISVHTTNPVLHKKMLRYRFGFNIIEKLELLRKNGIEFHTQIVLIPDWNDGEELEKTLADLTSKKIDSLSVGIVPVGLTKFRTSLIELSSVNFELANETLKISAKFPKTYCSDEIYILAEKEIPSQDFYEGFPQLENGIGMIRLLLENWKKKKNDFMREIQIHEENLVMITGKLAYRTIAGISEEINRSLIKKTRPVLVTNYAFGENVTVSGLLTATDIINQIKLKQNEIPVFSSNMFNEEGLTLDGINKDKLKQICNGKFLEVNEEFENWMFYD
ncbi:MAG: DUF512 domain-containing protein [Candidatus Cloacimonetes bacterium]|nr:DUF512 domain-containing protein [Candidatus Cloacimonadota bacterium]